MGKRARQELMFDADKIHIEPFVGIGPRGPTEVDWLVDIRYFDRRIGFARFDEQREEWYLQLLKHPKPAIIQQTLERVGHLLRSVLGIELHPTRIQMPPHPAKLRKMQEMLNRAEDDEPPQDEPRPQIIIP